MFVEIPKMNLVAFVDIDDTLIRSFGSKRIPMVDMVAHVRALKEAGATLFAWSSGGGSVRPGLRSRTGVRGLFRGVPSEASRHD